MIYILLSAVAALSLYVLFGRPRLFRETLNEPCDESAYGDRPHVPFASSCPANCGCKGGRSHGGGRS